jgi:hypothetical protein
MPPAKVGTGKPTLFSTAKPVLARGSSDISVPDFSKASADGVAGKLIRLTFFVKDDLGNEYVLVTDFVLNTDKGVNTTFHRSTVDSA